MTTSNSQVRVGRRFLHKRYLDPSQIEHVPQLCQVTAIRQGRVYYKVVVRYSDREELRGSTFAPFAYFLSESVGAWQ